VTPYESAISEEKGQNKKNGEKTQEYYGYPFGIPIKESKEDSGNRKTFMVGLYYYQRMKNREKNHYYVQVLLQRIG